MRLVGTIELRLLPGRGLDVAEAWFRRVQLAWLQEPSGDDWRGAWPGGLITTCGLDNVGAASEEIDLHGTYAFLQAQDVRVDATSASARVDDPRGLRVERTITTAAGGGRVELRDRTRNVGDEPLEAPLLYHVNLGAPLWSEGALVDSDAEQVVPRDEDAARGPWGVCSPEPQSPERVYEHVGATQAIVTNEALGLRVRVESNLPRLWQWIDPSLGALGIEPANCSVLGRAHDRAEGRLPFLAAGEERETRIVVTAEER